MFLIYDTETTGLPKNWNAPITDSENWPRMVQISWQIHDEKGELVEVKNYIIKPEGYEIPYAVEKIHGISTERANKQGVDLSWVLEQFNKSLEQVTFVVGHNIGFDINIVGAEFHRKQIASDLMQKATIDTKDDGTDFCKLPGGRGGGYKWPKLGELHRALFNEDFAEAHNAAADVEATARCFLEMIRLSVIPLEKLNFNHQQFLAFTEANPDPIRPIGLNTQPYSPLEEGGTAEEETETLDEKSSISEEVRQAYEQAPFVHLHLHTQYSLLDGASDIKEVAKKAKEDKMPAVAITDHGNMFGVKTFHKTLMGEDIKPILGCEAYVARVSRHQKESAIDKSGWHLVLLAKNEIGYQNLTKLVSLSWLEGYYYKPRIDKEILEQYSEGLIALSACLGGEVSQKIMNQSYQDAKEAALWYKSIFKDDFYLEIQRHKTNNPETDAKIYNDQTFVNEKIRQIAQETDIKLVATNDVHFVEEEDAHAQERLLCISTGKFLSDKDRMKYSGQEWMKTQSQMKSLFTDVPEAIINIQEIIDKVEVYQLNRSPIMPEFDIPEDFGSIEDYQKKYTEADLIEEFTEDRFNKLGGYDKVLRIKFESDYLEKITYEGADLRWDDINEEIRERVDFELNTIKTMGFPGYFLIVWDFLKAAREIGVSVGPGRGSAAGSAVAYCLKITDLDPVKYDLLFERFLNPDRISMPDIDIDFDDDGRGRILKWVVDKYGEKRVAHIITFGTLAAKSAIRDVGRVQQYPLAETSALQKLVPDKPGTKLKGAFEEVQELADIRNGSGEAAEVLKYAEVLEGAVRNTGTHACGIIIGADDLEKYIPISTAKDSELTYVTQYDGKHVEDVGLLKMDFLGLKTLSIIKDAVENVKLSKGIEIDVDDIPLDDKATFELYAKGETTGLFQFESDGMKKYLRELKPERFEDLIAMNALYRPGPMDYIPSFIKRKHGEEPIDYDVPMMKKYLENTYGITVYQEQVMLLSRLLANFTRGESDSLRKAMGKKIIEMMDELKIKFVSGCKENEQFVKECKELNKDVEATIEKIWSDWEAFAKYAFNKSHATCYSYVSYQSAYLKAHYPEEFMAAVLSRNLNDIAKVTFFMEECQAMDIKVAGPDVNASYRNFTVDKNKVVRFGMQGIKGLGSSAVDNIIEERTQNGEFKDIFDFVKRVNLTSVNKKNIESLVYAGAFDEFPEIAREQFFHEDEQGRSFIEHLIRFGHNCQNDQTNTSLSLFGDELAVEIQSPDIPKTEEWSSLKKLEKEKEHIGVYLSSHPLDEYKYQIKYGGFTPLSEMSDLSDKKGKNIKLCGFITQVEEYFDKKGNPIGVMTLEDYSGSYKMKMKARDGYLDQKGFFTKDLVVMVKGRVSGWTPKDKDEELFFFNPTSVNLFSNLKDQIIDSISLKIDIENLTKELLENLLLMAEMHQGKVPLQIGFYDAQKNPVVLNMTSRTVSVELNDHILKQLDEFNIEYKVSASKE